MRIWVDASLEYLGFAGNGHQMTGVMGKEKWGDKGILEKEMAAIYIAVGKAPPGINLRIYSDSMACLFAFRKGHCENKGVAELLEKTWNCANRKGIVFTIRHGPSEENKADYPSRNPCEGEFEDCFEEDSKMAIEEVLKFYGTTCVETA